MSMKICIFIPTANQVEPECLASIEAQTYRPHNLIVSRQEPVFYSGNEIVNLYMNCSKNRNKARAEALATDADYFLSLDSDIVLPPTAIAEFVKQTRPDNRIIGGWYRILRSDRWVAGKLVADNVFFNFRQPESSLIKADMVGLGCAFMSRKVLEDIEFEGGTNLIGKNEYGEEVIVGECGVFGNRCYEIGYPLYMLGDVICKHLQREMNATH